MKKMIVFAVAFVAAVMSQAAQLDWKYSAKAQNVGEKVYVLLGTTAISEWESEEAVSAKSVSNGTVAKKGALYTASGSISSDKGADISKTSASVYYVVVASDGKSFGVTSVSDMTASVYEPENQESALAANTSLSPASITKSGLAWGSGSDPVVPTPTPIDPSGVPEPTSGLLLLVGGAALALRRKQK